VCKAPVRKIISRTPDTLAENIIPKKLVSVRSNLCELGSLNCEIVMFVMFILVKY